MSGNSRRKRRKPTEVDKRVYVNYGLQGKFNVADLMDDYETVDFNSLEEAQAENIDERAAARTLDLLVKYKGNPPAKEWNEAVRDREQGIVAEQGSMMAFTTDEMELSEGELAQSSDSDEVMSARQPQAIKWQQYQVADLKLMPSVSFCNTLRIDQEAIIELESMLGKRKTPDEWKTTITRRLKADFRNAVELVGGTIVQFRLGMDFLALLVAADGELLNYFNLKAVKYEY